MQSALIFYDVNGPMRPTWRLATSTLLKLQWLIILRQKQNMTLSGIMPGYRVSVLWNTGIMQKRRNTAETSEKRWELNWCREVWQQSKKWDNPFPHTTQD